MNSIKQIQNSQELYGTTAQKHMGSESFLVGTVMDVDPSNKVAAVILDLSDPSSMIKNVQWLSTSNLLNGGGFNFIPTRGMQVMLAFPANFSPVIVGSVDFSIRKDLLEKQIPFEKPSFLEPLLLKGEITTGNKSKPYNKKSNPFNENHSGMTPKDLHMGDQEIAGLDEERVGVYRGGMVLVKASQLSQILLFKLKNLIRVVARNFEMFNDAGSVEIKNKDNKLTVRSKFASLFKEEGHPLLSLFRHWKHIGDGPYIDKLTVTLPTPDLPIPGVDPFDSLVPLYQKGIKPTGAVEEFTVETSNLTAIQDITRISVAGSIADEALLNITSKATTGAIEQTSLTQHIVKSGLITLQSSIGPITIQSASLLNIVAPVLMSVTSPLATFTGAGVFGGAVAAVAGVTTGGPIISGGPLLSGGASPGGNFPTLNGTQFMQFYNAHTHTVSSSGGMSSPPVVPLSNAVLSQSRIS